MFNIAGKGNPPCYGQNQLRLLNSKSSTNRQQSFYMLYAIWLCCRGKRQLQSLKEVLRCLLLVTPENMKNQDCRKNTFSITQISGIWVLIVYLKFLEREENKQTKTPQKSISSCMLFQFLKKKKAYIPQNAFLNWYYIYIWKHQEQNIKLPKHSILIQSDKYPYSKLKVCLQDWQTGRKLTQPWNFPQQWETDHWKVYRINVSHSFW